VDPDIRVLLLTLGIVFCVGFGAMTLVVASEDGIDVTTVVAGAIVVFIGLGLAGAMRNPPDR
jgi:hypothetical protein